MMGTQPLDPITAKVMSDFDRNLAALTFNSKPVITTLTMIGMKRKKTVDRTNENEERARRIRHHSRMPSDTAQPRGQRRDATIFTHSSHPSGQQPCCAVVTSNTRESSCPCVLSMARCCLGELLTNACLAACPCERDPIVSWKV